MIQIETTDKKVNKIGLRSIVSWGLGGLLVLAGAIEFFSQPVMGVFTLLAGLLIFPPAVSLVKNKFNFELSLGLKILAFLAFLILLGIGRVLGY